MNTALVGVWVGVVGVKGTELGVLPDLVSFAVKLGDDNTVEYGYCGD